MYIVIKNTKSKTIHVPFVGPQLFWIVLTISIIALKNWSNKKYSSYWLKWCKYKFISMSFYENPTDK